MSHIKSQEVAIPLTGETARIDVERPSSRQRTRGSRPRVVVSHSGKQHAYRLAAAVQQAGGLAAFVTSGYYKPTQFPDRLAASVPRLDAFLRRRTLTRLDPQLVRRNWRFEIPELVARRMSRFGIRDEPWIFRRDAAFDSWMAKQVRRDRFDADMLWGFQGSCLASLRAGRDRGLTTVVELAAPHVTTALRLLRQEADRHPEWADSIGNFHFPDWYRERLEQEPHAAELCVVASRFAADSLTQAGVAESRIRRVPLGADLSAFSPVARRADGPFRILFVGKVGQHKGIKYLLDAFRMMRASSTELVIAGPVVGSGKAFTEYRGSYTWLGPLSTSALADEMRRCDVMVSPSVIDGFGLVIAEAMASGMPVVATTHSIGPEIIREGISGFIVEPGDVESLAKRLDWLAANRADACEMGEAAAADARRFSWEAHAVRVAELLREFGDPKTDGDASR